MEKKQNFPSRAGLSGKILIASLFILSGLMLLARNLGWIPYEVFNIIVSWQSLLIILGVYTMTRRHYMGGIILVLIGAYFMLGGISWLPASSQALVWPVALIVIGVFFLIKTRKRARWRDAYMRHHRQWMNGSGGQAHRTTDETQQQCESEDGFLRSNNTFGAVRHVVLDELFKGAYLRTSFGGTTIDLRHTHLAPGETYIDLDCNWGGIELYIPSDWKVVVKCNAFVGGCDDKRWQGANVNNECVLVIRGNISFGGVEIKD